MRARWLHLAILVALPFVVYANNYNHAYHLDDAYTIVSNPSVRSLRAIPSYFVDPSTYTTLREQADYRPVLQLTYALNYRMGGYATWWWHFTQIVLHVMVTLGIYALCLRVLALTPEVSGSASRSAVRTAVRTAVWSALWSALWSAVRSAFSGPSTIALAAAAIFAVHPASSGVVNYLNARSSLLTAALLLPALLLYMRSADLPNYARPQWTSALFFTLALFTKVEAVGMLGAFWAFELWQRAREALGHAAVGVPAADHLRAKRVSSHSEAASDAGTSTAAATESTSGRDVSHARAIRASFDRRTLTRLGPALVVTVIYFIIRWRVMAPFPFADTRHAPDVGASDYLATQLTAWWYYVARWVAPVRLVADYLAYPVFRSWRDPVVLLAAGGWIAVGALLVAAWKRSPYLLFLAVASLALLSPTSSVAPLAEMVNEHRPYLPIAILSLAAVIPAGLWLRSWPTGRSRTALAAAGGLMLLSLGMLTYRRNEVFSTPNRFWEDVLAKAPSSRAHLNYGIALMKENDMRGALREFHSSLALAPFWYYTHINMGVAYQHMGQPDSARAYFDRAVQNDRYSGLALTWRGEYLLAQRDYAAARDDFSSSLPVGLQRYRNIKGLATAFAGLGDADKCLEHTARLLEIDRATALTDIPAISTPFFETAELRVAGKRYYEALQSRLPGESWIAENISRLSRAPSGFAISDSASQAATMSLGLDLLYRRNDPRAAAEQFHKVLRGNPLHYGATYQLATALERVGEKSQARALWVKVLGMATATRDAPTAATARRMLAGR